MADDPAFDLLVVGGGINGTGIARDAAGRGLSVLLCEQGDLAGATSSASSKLIHGGLRYLEHGEFRLVREALAERETLMAIAPHLVRPLRFVLPHDASMRPAWMIRLGLFLYDHLGRRRTLPGCRLLNLRHAPEGAPLGPERTTGFTYADCRADDARLVVVNAIDAQARGAVILTRTRCAEARRADGLWRVRLKDAVTGAPRVARARLLINAAGPWVARMLHDPLGCGQAGSAPLRLVKGSHLVMPRLYPGDHAYILQNTDRRVVFILPFEDDYSLIGTTDVPFAGDPAEVRVSPEETAYLCAAVSRWLRQPVAPADAVHRFAGVRSLYDDNTADPSKVTRDYVLDLDAGNGRAPLLTVYGGKLTTYRRLAEQALARLAPFLPGLKPPWTATAPLPGGDLPAGGLDAHATDLGRRHPWLPADRTRRYARLYGTLADRVIGDARCLDDLGPDFGAGLHEREAAWLADHEWAVTAEDILWRRTKLGLRIDAAGAGRLARWLTERHPVAIPAPARAAE